MFQRYPHAGVGECGLDKARTKQASLAQQKEVFTAHLEVAVARNRPLSPHCVRQYGGLLEMLPAPEAGPPVILHAWAGPADMVKPFAARGAYFSVGCREVQRLSPEALQAIPRDRLLVETDDAPLLPAEEGASGGDSPPAHALPRCIAALAAKLGEAGVEALGRIAAANAARAFAAKARG